METTAPLTGEVKPLRILVIEDNRDGAESLRLLIQLAGHDVRVTHTGSAGVEAARDFRPAVVLCNLGLPRGMSGYDVARVFRHDPSLAGVRLVAVTGYGQPQDRERARAAGFDFHLTKPVDPAELHRRLSDSRNRLPPRRSRIPLRCAAGKHLAE